MWCVVCVVSGVWCVVCSVWVAGNCALVFCILLSSVARVLGLVAGLHGVFENAADICLGILFHLCLWSVVCGVFFVLFCFFVLTEVGTSLH